MKEPGTRPRIRRWCLCGGNGELLDDIPPAHLPNADGAIGASGKHSSAVAGKANTAGCSFTPGQLPGFSAIGHVKKTEAAIRECDCQVSAVRREGQMRNRPRFGHEDSFAGWVTSPEANLPVAVGGRRAGEHGHLQGRADQRSLLRRSMAPQVLEQDPGGPGPQHEVLGEGQRPSPGLDRDGAPRGPDHGDQLGAVR